MTPYVYKKKFMWNLDCSVGQHAANTLAPDVSFIQWYYVVASDFHLTSPANKEIYRNVRITGFCNGMPGDPLVAAITAQQQSMNHPYIDGKVSVVTGAGMVGEADAFFLLRLEARFAVMFQNAWPRLDLIPMCPDAVSQVSRSAIPEMAELARMA